MEPAKQIDIGKEQRWASVRRWPALSAEGKLAWWLLYQRAGMRVDTRLQCHVGAVGEDQGAADASRSGRRYLEALAHQGLLQVLDMERGLWTVYLEDPVIVERARLVRAASEGQGELFPEEPKLPLPEPVGTVPFPHFQAPTQPPPAVNQPAAVAPLPKVPFPGVQTGGSGGGTAGLDPGMLEMIRRRDQAAKQKDKTEPTAAGGAIGAVMARVQFAMQQQPADAAGIARWIWQEVADPNLAMQVCDRIAWHIVEGVYPRSKMASILRYLKKNFGHASAAERGKVFCGAMRRSFQEIGLDLYGRRKPQITPPAGEEVPLP